VAITLELPDTSGKNRGNGKDPMKKILAALLCLMMICLPVLTGSAIYDDSSGFSFDLVGIPATSVPGASGNFKFILAGPFDTHAMEATLVLDLSAGTSGILLDGRPTCHATVIIAPNLATAGHEVLIPYKIGNDAKYPQKLHWTFTVNFEGATRVFSGNTTILITGLSETWPDNTACSLGERFRDTYPGLTDKWYMYTALDLAEDGIRDIPLIASNRYRIGTVHVNIQGGNATVSYSLASKSISVKEEFLSLLPSLDGLTAVEPEALADKNLPFGNAMDLKELLGEGRKAILYMRLLVTYDIYAEGVTEYFGGE
jgi:hypothetical protein